MISTRAAAFWRAQGVSCLAYNGYATLPLRHYHYATLPLHITGTGHYRYMLLVRNTNRYILLVRDTTVTPAQARSRTCGLTLTW